MRKRWNRRRTPTRYPSTDPLRLQDPFLYIDTRENWHVVYHVYNTVDGAQGGLGAHPGPPRAPSSIQKGARVLISLWDSLMFGRVLK